MDYSFKGGYDKAGLPPGTLSLPEGRKEKPSRVTVMEYSAQDLKEKEVPGIGEARSTASGSPVTWINIEGIHDPGLIEETGRLFGLHPLHLEDILNTDQRPKLEEQEEYLFVVMKMIYLKEKSEDIEFEQLGIFLSENTVITFQEREGDVFEPVRNRIRKGKGRIRRMGADYLAYALIDAVVDNYFVIPERFGEKIDGIEMELLESPSIDTLRTIHKLKRDMIFLRKAVWPLREVINNLERTESGLIKESTSVYLRDVYNHTIQVADSIETFRDMLSGMVDLYMSSISNRMNETMKVLTVIATIFIPLTFIAGIYGMNFDFMPELNWKYGYFIAMGAMAAIALGMLFYFRKKRWI